MGAADDCCSCLKNALINLAIAVFLIVFSPVLLVELLLLVLCNVRCLPPLSCMLWPTSYKGVIDAKAYGPHPKISAELLKKKKDVEHYGIKWWQATGTVAEQVQTMCELMIEYNTVPCTRECPSDFTGVFWMDGNAVPEELACLSYAAPEKNPEISGSGYMINKVNTVCSWTYLDSNIGRFIAWFQERSETTGFQSFIFDSKAMEDGEIESLTSYNFEDTSWLNDLGTFSMERLPGPGVNFKRGCYWFSYVFGRRVQYGSYTLRKIMTTDKQPVQPAYSEFIKYMETANKGYSMMTEAPPDSGDLEDSSLIGSGASRATACCSIQ